MLSHLLNFDCDGFHVREGLVRIRSQIGWVAKHGQRQRRVSSGVWKRCTDGGLLHQWGRFLRTGSGLKVTDRTAGI